VLHLPYETIAQLIFEKLYKAAAEKASLDLWETFNRLLANKFTTWNDFWEIVPGGGRKVIAPFFLHTMTVELTFQKLCTYTLTVEVTFGKKIERCLFSYPPAPMNHVKKYLRAGPPEMPLRNWYKCSTKHFQLTSMVKWKWKNQLDWVIKPVPHDLVRRIRFWRIKISGTWF